MIKTHTYTERVSVENDAGEIQAQEIVHQVEVNTEVPKLGLMFVGWGGNNGSTLTTGLLANKQNVTWKTRRGKQTPNFFGSLTQAAVVKVGIKHNKETNQVEDVFKVVKDLCPIVNPNDIQVTGWDISKMNIYDSCYRAGVLEPTLIDQLEDQLKAMNPMKAVFNPNYIAANQSDRADNVFEGTNQECVDRIRADIANFRKGVDSIVVLWTANTEKMMKDAFKTAEELEKAIADNNPLPGSVLYGVACALEKVIFLNGSPQNTVSAGMIDLYKREEAFIGGSDFKTGQTKFKTSMLDFFMGSGLRISSVMSYNHLGNNDGKNLQDPSTFESKALSKAGVMDDVINSNPVLYPKDNNKIDHTIVIKYCPFVGDSKRAMDEYTAEIFMNGQMTLITHATCEDSLLAAPIMLDLVLLAEFFSRVKVDGKNMGPVLSYLSFFFKAPVTNHPEYVFNAFSRQKETLINFLKVCGNFVPGDNTLLSIGF